MDSTDNKLVLLPDSAIDEAQLVERLKACDSGAFYLLYQRYVARLLRVARALLGSQSAAEDAVQEAFVRIFRGIGDFRGDASLDTWMHRITTNICLSEVKRRDRASQREREVARPREELVTDHAPSDARHDLLPMLERLEPQQRAIFVLHHVGGLSAREIAHVLGQSRDAVLKRLQRTRRGLVEALQSSERGEALPDAAVAGKRRERGGR